MSGRFSGQRAHTEQELRTPPPVVHLFEIETAKGASRVKETVELCSLLAGRDRRTTSTSCSLHPVYQYRAYMGGYITTRYHQSTPVSSAI